MKDFKTNDNAKSLPLLDLKLSSEGTLYSLPTNNNNDNK